MQPMDAASSAMVWIPGLDCKVGGSDAIQLGKWLEFFGQAFLVWMRELHGKGPSDSLI